jgi:LacI family transcriptional regulator
VPASPDANTDGPPDDLIWTESRRPTINDIARLAAVSKKTVSRVINDSPFVKPDTREKIARIIDQLGYEPDPQARGLAFRRSFLIGFIYDNPNPQYVVNAQQGLLDGLKGTGFELVVRPCDRASPTFLAEMRAFVERQKLSGVVLFPALSEDERLISLLRDLGCSYVRVASVALEGPSAMLVSHDGEGAAEAARYLAGLGHRLIGHIRGPDSFRSSHVRLRGFAEGLAACGVTLDPAYVKVGGYTYESGLAQAEAMLALDPRPTAIFTGNDEMAMGVYQAAREAGLRIPRDLSVVGYDDSVSAARVWPTLTTVRLPVRDMGRQAADMLMKQDQDRARAAPRVTPVLVVRESAGPPRR